MPIFTMMPVDKAVHEAEASAMPGDLAPYAAYLNDLAPGEAGRLSPADAEDVRSVRLRLSAAARRMNRKIVIRRVGNDLLFWENTQR